MAQHQRRLPLQWTYHWLPSDPKWMTRRSEVSFPRLWLDSHTLELRPKAKVKPGLKRTSEHVNGTEDLFDLFSDKSPKKQCILPVEDSQLLNDALDEGGLSDNGIQCWWIYDNPLWFLFIMSIPEGLTVQTVVNEMSIEVTWKCAVPNPQVLSSNIQLMTDLRLPQDFVKCFYNQQLSDLQGTILVPLPEQVVSEKDFQRSYHTRTHTLLKIPKKQTFPQYLLNQQ